MTWPTEWRMALAPTKAWRRPVQMLFYKLVGLDDGRGELESAPHPDLREDRLQVIVHRVLGYPEGAGDGCGIETPSDEPGELCLSRREAVAPANDIEDLRGCGRPHRDGDAGYDGTL